MTRLHSLKAALAAGVCLLPLQALAAGDDSFDIGEKPASAAVVPPSTNYVDLGLQYDSAKSDYLGRFTGATDQTVYGLGGFHYGERDAWDSGGTNYWEVDGKNLGLWDRSASAKAGQQGLWDAYVYYQGIPYYATESLRTIYQSNGALIPDVAPGSLTWGFTKILPKSGALPAIWEPNFGPGQAPKFINDSVNMRRDIFGGGGKFEWGAWIISSSLKHDHKEGTQVGSLEFGGTGVATVSSAAAPTTRTTGVVYFPQPIDYDMDTYNLTAAYAKGPMQAQFGYTYSQFTDNVGAFNVQNPFLFNPLTSFSGASPASLTAVYALPPSNSAHQFKGQLGYNFDPTTRLNANFGYDLMLQDDPFQTGTGNPNIPQTLPRSSFNGKIENFFGNLALTARPIKDMDLRVAYTIDDRANRSPQNVYGTIYTRSSNADQGPMLNLPFSYDKQSGSIDLGYRLAPETKISIGDTYDRTFRDYTDVSLVNTNRITAKIRSGFGDGFYGALSAAHEDRTAHNYDGFGTWRSEGCTSDAGPGDCGTEPAGFLMFFEASRVHDEVKGTVDASPNGDLNASLMVKYSKDRYPDSQFGLTNNHNLSVGPDVSWKIAPELNTHLYYTFQEIYHDASSIYTSGNPATTGYYVPWTAKTTDSTHTVGLSADWDVVPDELKLGLDYNLSYGDTAYALGDGGALVGAGITSQLTLANLAFQPLPDVKTTLSTISLHGERIVTPGVTVTFGYSFERFIYGDFMQNSSTTQYADLLLPGSLVPNASEHIVSAGVHIRF